MSKIKVNAARCRRCNTLLTSRSVHDWVECRCGNFVDGGRDYLRRGGKVEELEELSEFEEEEGG